MIARGVQGRMDLIVPAGGVSFACAGVDGRREFVSVKVDGTTKRMLRRVREQNNDKETMEFGRTCGTCYSAIGSEVPLHPSRAKRARGSQDVLQSKNVTLPAVDSGPTFYNSVQPDRTLATSLTCLPPNIG